MGIGGFHTFFHTSTPKIRTTPWYDTYRFSNVPCHTHAHTCDHVTLTAWWHCIVPRVLVTLNSTRVTVTNALFHTITWLSLFVTKGCVCGSVRVCVCVCVCDCVCAAPHHSVA
jgi:hypothetical protein